MKGLIYKILKESEFDWVKDIKEPIQLHDNQNYIIKLCGEHDKQRVVTKFKGLYDNDDDYDVVTYSDNLYLFVEPFRDKYGSDIFVDFAWLSCDSPNLHELDNQLILSYEDFFRVEHISHTSWLFTDMYGKEFD